MSVRRLLALVAGLPPDAAVNRDGKQWTDDREFAARMVERIDYWGAKHAELLSASAGFKTKSARERYLSALDPAMRITHPERKGDTAEKPTLTLRHLVQRVMQQKGR